jgi:hypothetical protein
MTRSQVLKSDLTFSLAVASLLTALQYFSYGNVVFTLWDDGFFWDGSLRALDGDVPIRDFTAYDPARYYWSAAFASAFGRGLNINRLSCAIFGSLGLAAATFLLQQVLRSRIQVFVAASLVAVSMVWFHRMFGYSAALITILLGFLVVKSQSSKKLSLLGFHTGLLSIFGRNHAIYALIANIILLALINWHEQFAIVVARFKSWLLGLLLGLMPFALMLLFIPGLFAANVDWVELLVLSGALNIPVPFPWFWQSTSTIDFISNSFFVVVPICSLVGIFAGGRAASRQTSSGALLVAAAPITLTFFHSALSRPDLVHLADASGAFLLTLVGLFYLRPWSLVGGPAVFCLASMTLFSLTTTVRCHPLMLRASPLESGSEWTTVKIDGVNFHFAPSAYDAFHRLSDFVQTHVGDETFALIPDDTAIYGFLGRTSPLFDSFPTRPIITESWERRMIRSIQRNNVTWILIKPLLVDNRPELFFANSYPLTMDYIASNFQLMPELSNALGRAVYKRQMSSLPTQIPMGLATAAE